MKRVMMFAGAVLAMSNLTGCQAIHGAIQSVEEAIKSPPEWVLTSLSMLGDFVLGILNIFLHGILSGLPGVFGM